MPDNTVSFPENRDAETVDITIVMVGGESYTLSGEKNNIGSAEDFCQTLGVVKTKEFESQIKAATEQQAAAVIEINQLPRPVMIPPMTQIFHKFVTLEGSEFMIDILAIQYAKNRNKR